MHWSGRYRYRFGDIDDAGIAYYPALFHYLHCAFEDFWQDGLGMPYPRLLHEEKVGFPAVHIESDFRRPIRYGDEPTVHVGVVGLGTSSAVFGFWCTVDGEVTSRAVITTVAVDMDGLTRLEAIPPRWRRELERFRLDDGELPPGRG